MVYCYMCNSYINLFTLRRFCDDCDNLRRLYLISEKADFLDRVHKEFIKQPLNKKLYSQIVESKQEKK